MAVLAHLAAFGSGGGHQAVVAELENVHAAHFAAAGEGTHVDEEDVAGLALLEPGAGVPHGDAPLGAGFQQLAGPFGQWGHIVAHREGQHHKAQAQHQQGAQGLPGPQAAGTHDGEFGALCQPGHHKDGADEYGDGQQLVEVVGNGQRHHHQRRRHRVGAGGRAAHPAQLIDKVEKEEKGQEGHRDKSHGGQDFLVEEAAQCFHCAAFGVRRQKDQLQLLWRLASSSRLNNSTPPCRPTRKVPIGKRPDPTQLCPRLSRL